MMRQTAIIFSVSAIAFFISGCARDEMKAPDAVPVVAVTTGVKSSFYDCSRMALETNKRTGMQPQENDYFPVRILAPNSAAIMDHNMARLNIYVDDGGKVISSSCG